MKIVIEIPVPAGYDYGAALGLAASIKVDIMHIMPGSMPTSKVVE